MEISLDEKDLTEAIEDYIGKKLSWPVKISTVQPPLSQPMYKVKFKLTEAEREIPEPANADNTAGPQSSFPGYADTPPRQAGDDMSSLRMEVEDALIDR